ncbi:DUF4004 family protein [Paenibacillus kobensis]|uniref:DUF4004 family protein n=1 Tax=Paenibacillus kobensis TaxID=59841 RepID=UPI000FD96AE9|nr:DUF4004 family protein [Paenibacillus kobensis]
MEQELISKKDLLEQMDISYGQLYRWKRKRLIPEEWFIRKSTFTGQETFFPKPLIIARIGHILQFKDDLSLDELAGTLSPLQTDIRIGAEELRMRGLVSEQMILRHAGLALDSGQLPFDQAFYLYVAEHMSQLLRGEITEQETGALVRLLRGQLPKLEGKLCELVALRTESGSSMVLHTGGGRLYADERTTIAASIHLDEAIEAFKKKLYAY